MLIRIWLSFSVQAGCKIQKNGIEFFMKCQSAPSNHSRDPPGRATWRTGGSDVKLSERSPGHEFTDHYRGLDGGPDSRL